MILVVSSPYLYPSVILVIINLFYDLTNRASSQKFGLFTKFDEALPYRKFSFLFAPKITFLSKNVYKPHFQVQDVKLKKKEKKTFRRLFQPTCTCADGSTPLVKSPCADGAYPTCPAACDDGSDATLDGDM